MDEARRIEQEVHPRKVRIPKKIFLVGRERLSEDKRRKLDGLLQKYPCLKGFYWAKEKICQLYRQKSREDASRLLDNIILNLKSDDDAELVRWGNTLKRWRDPILNHFYNYTTNAFAEGCHTKINMLKGTCFGLKECGSISQKNVTRVLTIYTMFPHSLTKSHFILDKGCICVYYT